MKWSLVLVIFFAISSCTAVREVFDPITEQDKKLLEESSLNFEPLPVVKVEEAEGVNLRRIQLGKKLYFDPRLSKNNSISCNTCHALDDYGVDHQATSAAFNGQRGQRNAPSTYNAYLHISQFWDGRAKTVEEQALGHLLDKSEMGMPSEKAVLKKLERLPEYVSQFEQAFPSDRKPVKFRNIGIALGAFERTLVTPSRFDQYLRGDIHALSKSERQGLQKFTEVGCISCHNGSNLGGGMYQKLGAIEDYPGLDDVGLYAVTKNEDDRYFFKVPSLRNVAVTGPWLHDGSISELDQAISSMARYQLGEQLTQQEVSDIKDFLTSLTGELPDITKF